MHQEIQTLIPEIGEIPVFEKTIIPHDFWKDGLLVRTPNWLGDAVMAIPAVCQMKKMLPHNCGMFILAPKGIAPVFESLKGIVDRVIPLNDPHAFLSEKERQSVRRLQCGAGVLFNNSFRDALSLRMTGLKPLFGANARFRKLLLKRAFDFPPRLDHVWNKPHQAAKYLSIAYALGAPEWDGVMPDFASRIKPEKCPEPVRQAFQLPHVLCAAAGAAYGDAKRWPADHFAAVCKKWISEEHGNVILLGSKKEFSAAEDIRSQLPKENVLNLAGATALDEVIALMKQASAVLANDSGLMHLAAALGTPGTAPFGPTDPAATSPISKEWRLLCRKTSCSPCFKRECPLGTKACFDGITPDVVFETLCTISRKNS